MRLRPRAAASRNGMDDQTAAMIRNLELGDRLRAAPFQRAIELLEVRAGANVLDIGCGIGSHLPPLAEATCPGSHVIGLDTSHPALAYARRRLPASASAGGIALTAGDMRLLPFADDSFDLCWSVDCLGYPAADVLPLLKEVVRVARDGAVVAVLAWLSQSVLPGYAMLEARLNATASAFAPYLDQAEPEQHFMRLGRWFDAAGIRQVRYRSIAGEVTAPLDDEQRLAMTALFEMLWSDGLARAAAADQLEYARLCDPDSPECILNLPDYCGFFTHAMFSGLVRK